jgi:hypothetical protein
MNSLLTKLQLITVMLLTISATSTTANPINMDPPVNDLIENAIDLGVGPLLFNQTDVNFPEATTTNDGGQQGCTTGVAGIWYKFTATAVGEIGAGIFSPDSPIIVFYSSPNANATSGQELTHVNQTSNPCENGDFALIETSVGTHYYIYMKNNTVSNIHINSEEIFAVPENDLIENAISLNGLEDFFDEDIHFLIATNTGDNGQSGCDTDPVKAVWYKFTATIDGQVVAGIDTPPAGGGVVFYTAADDNATSGSELSWVDQPTNPCGPNNLSSINATAGTTYYLLAAKVGAFATGYADVSINLAGILGVSDNLIEGFSFYPNPVTSEINLEAKAAIDEVIIFNLLGQKVLAEKSNSTRKVVDMSFLQTGLYVMHVSSEGKSATYKILKK